MQQFSWLHQSGTCISALFLPNTADIIMFSIYMESKAVAARKAEIKKCCPFCHHALEEDHVFAQISLWTLYTADDWGSKCNQHFLVITK